MPTNPSMSEAGALPVIEIILSRTPPAVVAHGATDAQSRLDGWKDLEGQISGWALAGGEADSQTDEDGYRLPGSKAVARALEIAARLRESGVAAPQRSGQTANGGINFEWRCGNRTERLTVNARGETELARFEDSKLVSRKPISFDVAQR
ncbi:MAG TPA: hypothetical protein VFW87_23375 [Pirellulales bacterium]|nr:hypothetical protein [Pirellulales bacterium]